MALLLLGASDALAAPDDAKTAEPAKTKAAESKPSESKQPSAKPDPFVVPDGAPEQLLKYLETLGELEPPARDPQSVTLFNKKAAQAILLAADKILAAKPTERQAAEAVQWKLGALVLLDRMGDPGVDAKRKALPAELEKLGWKRLARAVQAVLLGQELARIREDDPRAFRDLFEKIKGHVSQGEIGRQEIGLIMETATAAERFGTESAVPAYADFAKILAASPNKDIASLGAKLQGAARRLTLVGKPMEIGGLALDGKALDWSKYRGKVVLVSFWATWCGPCREESKNIQENYSAFHDKGFEVVAVSIDKDREALVGYMKDNAPPWTVLFDQAARSDQADKTLATAYGVMGIPQLILLGKDGNVVALGVRGPQLGSLLKGLLGEPSPAGKGKTTD
jgi:thiol-disulfide isomerase/thioredoxin